MPCKHMYYFLPDRRQIPMCKRRFNAGIWCVNDLFKLRCPFWGDVAKEVPVIVETKDSEMNHETVVIPEVPTEIKEEPMIVSPLPEPFGPPPEDFDGKVAEEIKGHPDNTVFVPADKPRKRGRPPKK